MARGRAHYSEAFKLRVVEAVDSGMPIKQVSETFEEDGSFPTGGTVYNWWQASRAQAQETYETALEKVEQGVAAPHHEERVSEWKRMEEKIWGYQERALEKMMALVEDADDLKDVARTWDYMIQRWMDLAWGRKGENRLVGRGSSRVNIENLLLQDLRGMNPEEILAMVQRGPAALKEGTE